ncbi:piggyBac transposable element-derived protein 2-like [Rhopalosiphum padi]|uniref:piggyBac transposable element-derived protein 2-like n=1 Tax=Rhopalosiphum padi TaxID=40932 RepID=UPI00298E6044|nr:piggyBac transposable element-derived protein 2-like [Rhopalosiphum padi]
MEYLFSRGILSLGTVRLPRLPNCPLPDKKNEKKMKRGESMEYVTSYEKAPISTVIWKDNKAVKLVSTYCGETPKTKVTRFDRSKKKEIEIDCPKLVTEYNHNMGGVDLLDSHIVVNSWCLYKRSKKQKNEENEIMELAEWRKILAHSLIKSGEVRHSGRGRPSISIEKKNTSTRPQSVRPPKSVRTDKTDHWPTFTEKRERCKMPQYKQSFSTKGPE